MIHLVGLLDRFGCDELHACRCHGLDSDIAVLHQYGLIRQESLPTVFRPVGIIETLFFLDIHDVYVLRNQFKVGIDVSGCCSAGQFIQPVLNQYFAHEWGLSRLRRGYSFQVAMELFVTVVLP